MPAAPRHQVHATVRLRFSRSHNADLTQIADSLDDLSRLRNRASYQLAALPEFADASRATDAIQDAADGLALLDRIDNNPALRAAAIASIPP